ncbi:hypothetical protein TcG_10834 [Trypanosoma cruzi]|nr:hypothetical protein TcG_10834 [Trypanosoma cruzi]
MLSSGAVVVAFTGADAHLLFRTTLHTCNAFFRNASLLPNQKNANTSSARNNLKNRKIHYTDTKVDRPRRRQPQLGAGAGASQHTMRSCLVGCVHTALHHGGEAVAPCPAPTHLHGLGVRHGGSCTVFLVPHASSKDTSVHLAANPAPLRRIIGFRALTQHERLTRLRYMEDVRGAAPLGNHGIVNTLEGGDDYFSAGRCRFRRTATRPPPHAERRIVARDTASCSGLGVFQPRHARDALDGVRRSAVEAAYASLGPCVWICRAATRLPGQRGSLWASPRSFWQPCMILPSGVSCH